MLRNVDLIECLAMCILEFRERSACDDRLRTGEPFIPQQIDKRLHNEILLILNGFSGEFPRKIDDGYAGIMALQLRAQC